MDGTFALKAIICTCTMHMLTYAKHACTWTLQVVLFREGLPTFEPSCHTCINVNSLPVFIHKNRWSPHQNSYIGRHPISEARRWNGMPDHMQEAEFPACILPGIPWLGCIHESRWCEHSFHSFLLVHTKMLPIWLNFSCLVVKFKQCLCTGSQIPEFNMKS